MRPLDEIKTLSVVANSPADAADKLTAPAEQRSWQAFERIFNVIRDQGLPQDSSLTQYRAWLARYPQEQLLYSRFLDFLVAQKDYPAATQLVADYHKQFPGDEVFPVKAKAMVEYRHGSLQQGLEVYEQSFQPLWAPELVKSYFDLLTQTQSLRKFLDGAQAALNANPEDLNAMARVFYYYQQQGKLDAAQQTVTAFRLHKEARHSDWSGQDLYVCARLLQDIHAYPESARYYFALYNSKGMNDAQERSLAALTDLLLTAPESPIQFGSGELSMYRDIATMDQGPGYLNGILSLILNTTAPAARIFRGGAERCSLFSPRSRASELLKLLDTKFPDSTRRRRTARQTPGVLRRFSRERSRDSGRAGISFELPERAAADADFAAHGGCLLPYRKSAGRVRDLRCGAAGTGNQAEGMYRWGKSRPVGDEWAVPSAMPRRKTRARRLKSGVLHPAHLSWDNLRPQLNWERVHRNTRASWNDTSPGWFS